MPGKRFRYIAFETRGARSSTSASETTTIKHLVRRGQKRVDNKVRVDEINWEVVTPMTTLYSHYSHWNSIQMKRRDSEENRQRNAVKAGQHAEKRSECRRENEVWHSVEEATALRGIWGRREEKGFQSIKSHRQNTLRVTTTFRRVNERDYVTTITPLKTDTRRPTRRCSF